MKLGRGQGIYALMRYLYFLEMINSIRVRNVFIGKCDVAIAKEMCEK